VFHLVRRLLNAMGYATGIAGVPLSRLYLHPVAIAAWVNVCDLVEFASGWAIGRRTHRVRSFAARAQNRVGADDFGIDSSGAVLLDRMAALGGVAASERNAASLSSCMAGSYNRAPLADGCCHSYARLDLLLCSHFFGPHTAVGT